MKIPDEVRCWLCGEMWATEGAALRTQMGECCRLPGFYFSDEGDITYCSSCHSRLFVVVGGLNPPKLGRSAVSLSNAGSALRRSKAFAEEHANKIRAALGPEKSQ